MPISEPKRKQYQNNPNNIFVQVQQRSTYSEQNLIEHKAKVQLKPSIPWEIYNQSERNSEYLQRQIKKKQEKIKNIQKQEKVLNKKKESVLKKIKKTQQGDKMVEDQILKLRIDFRQHSDRLEKTQNSKEKIFLQETINYLQLNIEKENIKQKRIQHQLKSLNKDIEELLQKHEDLREQRKIIDDQLKKLRGTERGELGLKHNNLKG